MVSRQGTQQLGQEDQIDEISGRHGEAVGCPIARSNECARARGGICTMKKPRKTAAELEASIRVEMEDICDWPTGMTTSVQPDGDSWKVKVVQEGLEDNADRRQMVEQIAALFKAEYDLKD